LQERRSDEPDSASTNSERVGLLNLKEKICCRFAADMQMADYRDNFRLQIG